MSNPSAPRCAAFVGPYGSGKTTLLESVLFITGAIRRKGSVKEGNTVGDGSPESRERQMSVEVSAASTEYLGDRWTFLDCPGSIEMIQESWNVLKVVDAAVVVCEPVVERALMVAPLFKFLEDQAIPHLVFINKVDTASSRIGDVLKALRSVSGPPLVLRQVPIRKGEAITGYVDLASGRAYAYRPGQASELVSVPEDVQGREQSARTELLEHLADFDDDLLEKLLEDVVPSQEEVYQQLTKTLRGRQVTPVFLGAAEHDNGVRRLLKTLRHEVAQPSDTAERLGIDAGDGKALAQVFKTYHASHAGKLSLTRVWRGELTDGMTLNGGRVGGLFRVAGAQQTKVAKATVGEVVALGRMEKVSTGDVLTPSGKRPEGIVPWPDALEPIYALAVSAEKRADEVRLTGALAKLVEEDPSLSFEQNPDTNEMLLWGQGEIHLQVALARLRHRYNLEVQSRLPQVPYKETIRKSTSQHGRYKKQTGGHGQFGDVHLDIKPLPRGTGFEFSQAVVGGAVPRQYIPSVERGVKEYLNRGPLGFPIVDIAVTLTDGQHHSVDSSDIAFKMAGRIAMVEGMPKCNPVLLEPILHVTISAPNQFTSNVQRLLSGRRGQILGFQAKKDWKGWDEISAYLPQSEIHDLIVELRSLTLGVGTFSWKFDHLQELTGRLVERVIQDRAEQLAAT
ncbi:MAG: elongation factor G [Proteobacteria bacterium]|nr:elongation factor G [Pseudomonadota bacterium]